MHFRLLSAGGDLVDEGDGSVAVQDRVLTVSPQLGQPLRIAPEQISDVGEPQPFTLRIGLTDGSRLELSQLGTLRTQILAQVGGIRSVAAGGPLVSIGFGEPQRFHAWIDGGEADVSLYDDGLVAIPRGGLPVQVPYALVEDVTTDPSGYRVTVSMGEAGSVVVERMAQMTSQFLTQLRARVTGARGRTGAFLQALLPGLGPLAQRQLAADLRDGVAAPRPVLDAVDPTVWQTLVRLAALPDRVAAAGMVERFGEVALGFRQVTSVEVEAQGTFQTSEAAPVQGTGPGRGQGMDIGAMSQVAGGMMMERFMGVPGGGGGVGSGFGLGGPGGSYEMGGQGRGPEMGGPGFGFGSPYGAYGGLLALRMLRGDTAWRSGGEQQARSMFRIPEAPSTPEGSEGLIAAHTDFSRLGIGGDHPTIVAFLLARAPDGLLVYEPLNVADHATYVFRDPAMTLRQLNLDLMLIGFRVEVLAGDVTGLASRYAEAVRRLPHLARLATAYRGRAIHGPAWEGQLGGLRG